MGYVVLDRCKDGREGCEDCRERGVEEVKSAHFTLCQKPWECLSQNVDRLQNRLCRKMHGEWFWIWADLEFGGGGEGVGMGMGEGDYDKEHFLGFCKQGGGQGYIPMKLLVITD